MQKGLHIRHKQQLPIGSIVFWILLVAGLVVCGWYGYRFYMYGDQLPVPLPVSAANQRVEEAEVTEDLKQEHVVDAAKPRFISIPSIGVRNSRILPVGVAQNGELDTPQNIFDTGWYQESALPGDETGALLMDGHNGGPTKDGVYKKLPDVRSGDTIVVERGDGMKFSYAVAEAKEMPLESLDASAMRKLTESIDTSTQGLTLISCSGNWIPSKQTYSNRVVVRAVLES